MTTRIFTPRPAQPAAKTTATGAMEGWRIEVRRSLHGFDARWWTPDDVEMRVYMFALQPGLVERLYSKPAHPSVVWAAVRLDRDTIYVSRELTGDEPDTLRRLMAEECAGERRFTAEPPRDASLTQWSNTASAPLSLEGMAEAMRKLEAMAREPVGVVTNITHDEKGPLYMVSMGSRQHGKTEALRKAAVEAECDGLKVGRFTAALTDYGREFMARHAPPRPLESLQQALRSDRDAQREEKTAPRVPKVGEVDWVAAE